MKVQTQSRIKDNERSYNGILCERDNGIFLANSSVKGFPLEPSVDTFACMVDRRCLSQQTAFEKRVAEDDDSQREVFKFALSLGKEFGDKSLHATPYALFQGFNLVKVLREAQDHNGNDQDSYSGRHNSRRLPFPLLQENIP